MDDLFSGAPHWLDRMYEQLDERATMALKRDSQVYAKYQKRIEDLYETYPAFAEIVEGTGAEEHKPMLLTGESLRRLSELVLLQFDVMEMYQRVFYLMGLSDGIRLAEMLGDLEGETKEDSAAGRKKNKEK